MNDQNFLDLAGDPVPNAREYVLYAVKLRVCAYDARRSTIFAMLKRLWQSIADAIRPVREYSHENANPRNRRVGTPGIYIWIAAKNVADIAAAWRNGMCMRPGNSLPKSAHLNTISSTTGAIAAILTIK